MDTRLVRFMTTAVPVRRQIRSTVRRLLRSQALAYAYLNAWLTAAPSVWLFVTPVHPDVRTQLLSNLLPSYIIDFLDNNDKEFTRNHHHIIGEDKMKKRSSKLARPRKPFE